MAACMDLLVIIYTVICMQGESLGSLSSEFYSVAVGGGYCEISFILDTLVCSYICKSKRNQFGDQDMNIMFTKTTIFTLSDQLHPSS